VDWVFFDVEYAEKPGELNILDFRSPEPARIEEFIRLSFRTKLLRWSAEEEVRVVYKVDELNPPKVPVPPHTISALYLGPAITKEDRKIILGWSTRIPIYQVVVGSGGQYAFDLAKAAMP
jgi:hypothetical protein